MARYTCCRLSAAINPSSRRFQFHLSSSRAHRAQRQPLARTQHYLFYCTSCVAVTGSSQQAAAGEDVQYWDVVEYMAAQGDKPITRLGLVQVVAADTLQVAPLVEEDQDIWVIDEDAQELLVPAGDVIKTVEHLYSQMQDTKHNPHGEHAHDVWQMLCPLSPEVFRGYRTWTSKA